MSTKMFRLATAWGTLVVGVVAGPAVAQNCPSCAPPPVFNACPQPCPQPVCNVCEQLQPVVQPCYRTVPVTEYRPTKVTVQRPINETEWVDREVTEYRQVCDQRTAEVPTVNWQTVTECRTVQKDMGYWTTQYECNPKCSPCQYDPRPGIAGWWNRATYSMRTSMQPQYIARRQYVPNVVTQQVPVTRQVPQYGTRQVTYNVTRMEPYTTTRKVAVNKTRWVAEEVTQMQPVTVMKTIPSGTSIAWVSPSSLGSSATALAPTPDPYRSRASRDDYDDRNGYRRNADVPPPFGSETPRSSLRDTFPSDKDAPAPVPAKKISTPIVKPYEDGRYPEARVPTPVDPTSEASLAPLTSVPTIVKASRWTARNKPAAKPVRSNEGPALEPASVSVAKSGR